MQFALFKVIQQLYIERTTYCHFGWNSSPGSPNSVTVYVQRCGLPPPGQNRKCSQDCGSSTGWFLLQKSKLCENKLLQFSRTLTLIDMNLQIPRTLYLLAAPWISNRLTQKLNPQNYVKLFLLYTRLATWKLSWFSSESYCNIPVSKFEKLYWQPFAQRNRLY